MSTLLHPKKLMLESCLTPQVFARSPDVWLVFAWALLLFSCCFKRETDILYDSTSELNWVVLRTW